MKGFEIDFVRRPLPQWVGLAFFAASAVAFFLSWNHFIEQREAARSAAAAQRKALEDTRRPSAPSADDLKRRELQAQERAALAYPWRGVFDALEAAGGSEVKVVTFSHDRAARKSHVVLEGPNFGSIDAALTRMKGASPANAEWSIESISHEQSGAAGVVKATVAGSW